MSHKRLNLGKTGEDTAVKYLLARGHSILERNFATKYGEVDIITVHEDIIVFVEVKTRSSTSHGSPLDAVTKKKQLQIARTAMEFLRRKKLFDTDARFDVISVDYSENSKARVEHIANAFDLPPCF